MFERKNLIYVAHTCVATIVYTPCAAVAADGETGARYFAHEERGEGRSSSHFALSQCPWVAVKERKKRKHLQLRAAEIYKAERNNAELNRSLRETSGIVLEGDIGSTHIH